MFESGEILIISLMGMGFAGFVIHTISMLVYLISDRPLIAERLRRYGSISGN